MPDNPELERPTDDDDATAESAAPTLPERFRAAIRRADRWAQAEPPATPEQTLRELADEAAGLADPEEWDRYGERGPVKALEDATAELLGKPAAAMFPSGIMAQQSVLRVWSDRRASRRIAIPQLSHLLTYEADGPALLNGFQFEPLTTGATVPTADHLAAIPGRLGAALLELPLRDAGYLLPSWEELVEFREAATERQIPVHIDGARLWEAQPRLGHSLAEIAALADSVYVSFYKGLGGLSGAVVAGDEDVVDEARQWRKRHGGTLFSLTPNALSGLRGLRLRLPAMAAWCEYAVELAAALEDRQVRVFPQPPHTNAFRIFADGSEDSINERIVDALERDRIALIYPLRTGEMPGTAWTEFVVGSATLGWQVGELADAIAGQLKG